MSTLTVFEHQPVDDFTDQQTELEHRVYLFANTVLLDLSYIAQDVDRRSRKIKMGDAIVEFYDLLSYFVTVPEMRRHHARVMEIARSVTETLAET